MTRAITGTMLAFFAGCGAYGQAADAPVTFEVASVKPSPPLETIAGRGIARRIGCTGGPGTSDPGLFTCVFADITQLAITAFGLKRYQLPSFAQGMFVAANSPRFDIIAKVPPGATGDQLNLMLQSLLAERFKLTYHFEKRETQVYDLVVAKGGLKMKETPPEPPQAPTEDGADKAPPRPSFDRSKLGPDGFPAMPPPRPGTSSTLFMSGRMRTMASGETIAQIVGMLTGQVGRPVIDATGLKGKYDYALTFASDTMGGAGAAMPAPAEGGALAVAPESESLPSIFSAIQEQMGLKLEQKKGTVDMFIIDHAEKTPTEN